MKVINLFAGPSTGKSTLAAGLLHAMKTKGLRVELVADLPREEVYWESWRKLEHHLLQFSRIQSAIDMVRPHCDFAIVESPVLMRLVYAREDVDPRVAPLAAAMRAAHAQEPDSADIMLNRNPSFVYDPSGRDCDEAVARERDEITRGIVKQYAPDHFNVMAGDGAIERVMAAIGQAPAPKLAGAPLPGIHEWKLRLDAGNGSPVEAALRATKQDVALWALRHGREGDPAKAFSESAFHGVANAWRSAAGSLGPVEFKAGADGSVDFIFGARPDMARLAQEIAEVQAEKMLGFASLARPKPAKM